MKKCGYEGKIQNAGSQEVKAVFPTAASKSGKVKSGGDLRTGTKKK